MIDRSGTGRRALAVLAGSAREPTRLLKAALVLVVLVVLVAVVALRTTPGSRVARSTALDPVALDPVAHHVALRTVGRVDAMPIALAQRSTTGELWIATKDGRVHVLPAAGPGHASAGRVVLDIRGQVDSSGDQGLLNLSFSPDGSRLFLLYTDRHRGLDLVSRPVTGRRIVGRSRSVLRIPMPNPGHQGGGMAWGGDGTLYVGIGDGWRRRQAQSPASFLGKVIRIAPRSSGPAAYDIPSDNPHVGDPATRPEVWASGVRNPWRLSRDGESGRLWIGDVGDGALEEVDVIPEHQGGANLGWPVYEGTATGPVFAPGAIPSGPAPMVAGVAGSDRVRFQAPWRAFRHGAETCASVGGFVYRGRAIPGLRGRYVFADFCDHGLRVVPSSAPPSVTPAGYQRLVDGLSSPAVSMAEGADRELYVLLASGAVEQIVTRP